MLIFFLLPIGHLKVTHSISIKPKDRILINSTSIENKMGIMKVVLFTKADKFLKDPSYSEDIPVSGVSQITVEFKDIPDGTFVKNVFHDLNDNGNLDSNRIMIPKKPIGFSNNYFPKFNPTKFKNASFKLDQEKISMIIDLKTY